MVESVVNEGIKQVEATEKVSVKSQIIGMTIMPQKLEIESGLEDSSSRPLRIANAIPPEQMEEIVDSRVKRILTSDQIALKLGIRQKTVGCIVVCTGQRRASPTDQCRWQKGQRHPDQRR